LKEGAWPADWCWDLERGYIKVIGPVRDEPIDSTQVQDSEQLTDVDQAVMQWYRKELAKKYKLNYKDLFIEKGSQETVMLRAHRLVAQRRAKEIIADCDEKKRLVTDDELTSVLDFWGFAKNTARQNVMKEGVNWVWSDTVGLLRDRIGDIHLTQSTHGYPEVVGVLCRWLSDRLPAEAKGFAWTSLNINKNYAAAIHRDGNNFGPSIISAFGPFSGGRLKYHSEDDGKIDLDKLAASPKSEPSLLDLKNGVALFNGNCAHQVEDFEGNRYSIVYFTLGCHAQMKQEDRAKLDSIGFVTPKPDADPHVLLRPPIKDQSLAKKGKISLPASRYWKKADLGGHISGSKKTELGGSKRRKAAA